MSHYLMSLQTNTLDYYYTLQLRFCSISYSTYIVSDNNPAKSITEKSHNLQHS